MVSSSVLIYGLPHIGKTTLLLRILGGLKRPLKGFYSRPLFEDGKKSGIEIIAHNGQTLTIRRNRIIKKQTKYHLPPVVFDEFFKALCDTLQPQDIFYIDEIGPLFCESALFLETMSRIFLTHIVLGTVSRRGHRFIEQLHRNESIHKIQITANNRDALVAEISRRITGEL